MSLITLCASASPHRHYLSHVFKQPVLRGSTYYVQVISVGVSMDCHNKVSLKAVFFFSLYLHISYGRICRYWASVEWKSPSRTNPGEVKWIPDCFNVSPPASAPVSRGGQAWSMVQPVGLLLLHMEELPQDHYLTYRSPRTPSCSNKSFVFKWRGRMRVLVGSGIMQMTLGNRRGR